MRAAQAQYTTERPIADQFPGHGCMDGLVTERRFEPQATWVVAVLDLCFSMLFMSVLYNQILADVRSIGAGIKCLYCR